MSPIRRAASSKRGGRAPAGVVWLWLAAAGAGLSCGSPAPSSGHPVTRVAISAATGGTASIPGGRFKVQIPPGALKQDTAITIQQIDSPGAGDVGPVYDVGPTGTVFNPGHPVTLTFSLANVSVDFSVERSLKVATFSGGRWMPVTSAVDTGSGVVTGQISHLSPWTLIVYTPESDAGTGGDMDGGAGAGGNDDAAGDAAASGGTGGGTGGAKADASTGDAKADAKADAPGAAGAGAAGAGAAGAGSECGAVIRLVLHEQVFELHQPAVKAQIDLPG